ncbi:hypothetical protein ACSS7Z_09930 [Microbacterium sp. A82]|uniref:hypothetical protein n=1 Tax=Microbacterium sp. A82 TaxID=3450452 RepID=UPI003F35B3B0
MNATNHTIRPKYDIDLAIIEGTKVMAFCGDVFIPTVTPGTSGRADVPGARYCEACEESMTISEEWSRIKDEKNRLIREMRMLEKAHKSLIREQQELRTTTKRTRETVDA